MSSGTPGPNAGRDKDRRLFDITYDSCSAVGLCLIGERERAYLVVQTARFFYPALMYAVMFYVILNKRKLH